MSMTDARVPRFAALLREALAVLAAILVAFALDAWWDAHRETEAMYEALAAVRTEIERNVFLVDSTSSYNAAQVGLASDLLGEDPDAIVAMSEEELLRYANVPNYLLVTLEMGATSAFIEGGFLPALEDLELRALIAGLPVLQAELDEEAAGVQLAMNRFTPSIISAAPDEMLRDPFAMATPAGARGVAVIIATDRRAREAFLERTFMLGFLYAEELGVTRDRLSVVAENIDRVLRAR